ncbi:MAG TPA: tetratricopeptide repeat protein [Kofleriaceae bacterium]|nr:tetratricopeptide repeat protein [Kofleriaceae bacterium]
MRAVLILVLLHLPACFWVTTKSEGEQLQKDQKQLDKRVVDLEKGMDAKAKELQKVLDSATQLLARNSANIGEQVSTLENDIRELRGLLSEIKRNTDALQASGDKMAADLKPIQQKLVDLDGRLAVLEQKAAGPQTAPELFTAGKEAFAAKDYAAARGYFKKLVTKFPDDARAAEAQFLRAETHRLEKDWEQAIVEYQKIMDKYPKSEWGDDAFFHAGEAAEALKNCAEARAYYSALKQNYKSSSFVKEATSRDDNLKKKAKDSKVCKQ